MQRVCLGEGIKSAAFKRIMHWSSEDAKFVMRLDTPQRDAILKEDTRINSVAGEDEPIRIRILKSSMSDRMKKTALAKLKAIDGGGSSAAKVSEWVNGLLNLPIGVYRNLPVTNTDSSEAIGVFLKHMRKQMDEAVYGHTTAKDHVMRLIAQWISNPESKGLVLGVHGPPGVGKTELCRAICRCLALPFAFLPLGGISDGSYLDGHSYTYEGAMWGKVADMLMKCGCSNPVLFFDELDKISETRHGEEVVNLLIHMTDATQNTQFADKFFVDVDIDLSRCLMVFSYNNESLVSPVLLDRMTRISAKGYGDADKVIIAQDYLMPAILKEFGFAPDAIRIPKDVIREITRNEQLQYESGVRGLKRAMHDIVSHLNYQRLVSEDPPKFPIEVTSEHVAKYTFFDKKNEPMPLSVQAMYM